jgi:hypothetical protein
MGRLGIKEVDTSLEITSILRVEARLAYVMKAEALPFTNQ